jgi:hypothetical protein
MLTDYTTYAECRAALGTNADEIEDATLALPMYELGLVADFEDIHASLPADYLTIAAIAPETRTAAEKAVYEAARLFAPFSVAVQLASSLPLFSPKQITDGKAGFARYADSPYKEATKRAKEQFDRHRGRLATKYATYKSSSAPTALRPFLRGIAPTSDPVTG